MQFLAGSIAITGQPPHWGIVRHRVSQRLAAEVLGPGDAAYTAFWFAHVVLVSVSNGRVPERIAFPQVIRPKSSDSDAMNTSTS